MSFETDVAINGHGVAFQLEGSGNRFSGISYFWADKAHHWANTMYEPRIVSVQRLTRGLTVDHNLAASTVEVTLDNTDGGMDFLVNRATVETGVFKLKFRLYVVAYNPATPGTLTRKQLGQFGLLDFPKRDARTITLVLADDTSIDGAELAIAPSLKDWVTDSASTTVNNPNCKSNSTLVDSPRFFMPYEMPVQLAFGNIEVDCMKGPDFDLATTDANYSRRSLIVCATTDTGAVTAYDVEEIRIGGLTGPGAEAINDLKVPPTFSQGIQPGTLWTASRTGTLSKDGRNWKLIWIDLDIRRVMSWLMFRLKDVLGTDALPTWFGPTAYAWHELYRLASYRAAGWPYSSRTTPATTIPGFGAGVRAPEIAYDLLSYYSNGLSTSDVDLASFQSAANVLPGFFASGVIDDSADIGSSLSPGDPGTDNPSSLSDQKFLTVEAIGGRLRQVLAELSRSGSFDIFVGWSGTFKATAQVSNVTDQLAALQGTLPVLDETLIVDGSWEDSIPSPGERWAPHNRIYIEGKAGRIGPFDNASAITSWGRKLPVTLHTKWLAPSDYAAIATGSATALSLFNTAAIESKARQRIRFVYGSLQALELELGSYFKLSLSRGTTISALFSSAIFKVEKIDLLPDTAQVVIEAIWFDDLISDKPYILDDESYSVVVSAAGGRTATVTDSNTSVAFNSGDLGADNVMAGDVLVLKDATLAAGIFTRYRAIRIDNVPDSTHVNLATSDLDFDAPTGVAVAAWEIRRGWSTYSQLATSDPTHYASVDVPGIYGKVTDTNGFFSDSATEGHKLLDG